MKRPLLRSGMRRANRLRISNQGNSNRKWPDVNWNQSKVNWNRVKVNLNQGNSNWNQGKVNWNWIKVNLNQADSNWNYVDSSVHQADSGEFRIGEKLYNSI
ncbi:MAG: hypothetical protein Q3M24_16275 [Candidatus Electrothrix aestuarii]|uniref:Uncharacterized protein n=1 Tax=Candidatus Electrothrix aestuarii TaxID=3062594 RepID=A0AAU8LRD4_9BACT